MTRYTQSLATKGSQKWIQKLVNEEQEFLNSQIKKSMSLQESEKIEWRSPLEDDEYAEYRDEAFLERLCVKLEKVPLSKFWPKRGPQWDALGRSSSGKLFLVEAKSHISELVSSLDAEDKNSIKKIKESLDATKDFINSKNRFNWSECFYQYTNRLSHLYLLRKLNELPAYLVFVYFVNDLEMKGPTTISEWEGATKLLHSCLGIGRHKLREFVSDVFIDVEQFK